MSDNARERIRRATEQAQRQLADLDAETQARIEALYRDVAGRIRQSIRAAGGADGRVGLDRLAWLHDEIERELERLARLQQRFLEEALRDAALLSAGAVATAATVAPDRLATEAVRFVQAFRAADGLQLSDRLWRLNTNTSADLLDLITRQVILGNDATRAAEALVGNRVDQLLDAVDDQLFTGAMNPYDQARRLFRTELNRAHGEAYRAGLRGVPGAVGEKFLLSPAHPRPDICDYHARANLYGMGPGVYPIGQSPWPAHPNTLSFVVVVFDDEISETDRQRDDGEAWLRGLPFERLTQVFGGERKARGFLDGALGVDDIDKRLYEVEGRL